MNSQKTVIVGLSGGVDSSVSAMLLHEAGYRVIGVFLHFWSEGTPQVRQLANQLPLERGAQKTTKMNKCCSIETMLQARKVADALGIPFYTLDLSERFKEKVVDYFLSAYGQGWTPNPCIMCNRDIKFGAVFDAFSTFGADYWATGHYAKIAISDQRSAISTKDALRVLPLLREGGDPERSEGETEGSNNLHHLYQPRDLDKDQTYFLHALTQDKLSRTLFPLGDYLKSEVREMATKLNVEHYGGTYRESQNLCFYAEAEPDAFLERHLPKELQAPGDIKTREGKVVGTHRGLFHYTIGQRRGLGILPSLGKSLPRTRSGVDRDRRERDGRGVPEGDDPSPYFVTGLDLASNTLIVGEKEDLFSTSCHLANVTFTRPVDPEELHDLDIKVRYSKTSVKGNMTVQGSEKIPPAPLGKRGEMGNTPFLKGGQGDFTLHFSSPVRAVTPGQHAVFYRKGECLGGGVIIADPPREEKAS